MSDNNAHIDPAFTDQSWSEMKKLLDREMPVRAVPFFWFRKRFLWLLLLLIPIGAAWGYYYFGQQQKSTPRPPEEIRQLPVPSPPAEPIASAEEPNCDEPVLRAEGRGQRATTNPQSPILPAEAKAEVRTNHQSPIISIPYLATRIFYPEFEMPDLAFRIPHPASPSTVQSPGKSNWATILEAGPFASAGFQFGGVSGGVRFQRSLGKSAWGIQTGVGYSYHARPFPAQRLRQNVELADLANQEEAILSPPNNQMDFDTTLSFYAASTDSIVSRLHFLDIPVVATFQVGKHWQFYAGGGAGLLLASQTEAGTDAGSGLLRLNTKNRFDVSSPIAGMGEAIVSPNVRVLNPFLEGGVTFFPVKRLGISAQVNVGLRDMLSNWPGDQYVNKVQLKLSYRIK